MPIIEAARKALRQNKTRKEENLIHKKMVKSLIKDLSEFLAGLEKSKDKLSTENKKEAYKKLSDTYKAIDKATKKGIYKKNTAARKKSNLALKINRIEKR
ncbi:MAG: 30S ribosomal protein S20 [Minisyncoccia bacterium]